METRAPFVIVGAFVLAAIAAVFGFVYWLHNTGGLGRARPITSSSTARCPGYWSAPPCCSMESGSGR